MAGSVDVWEVCRRFASTSDALRQDYTPLTECVRLSDSINAQPLQSPCASNCSRTCRLAACQPAENSNVDFEVPQSGYAGNNLRS